MTDRETMVPHDETLAMCTKCGWVGSVNIRVQAVRHYIPGTQQKCGYVAVLDRTPFDEELARASERLDKRPKARRPRGRDEVPRR